MPSIPITDSMIFEEQPKDKKKSSKDKKQTSEDAAMEITTSTDKKKSKEKKSPKVEEPSSDDSAQLKKSKKKKKKRSAEETETETELVGESVKKQKLLENGEVVATPAVKEDPNATSRFRISKPLREKLKANGIEALFPIQAMTFDTILDGSDLVGRARTGQGKTLAFVLPILESLTNGPAKSKRKTGFGRSPSVLVLLPTRELANQVFADFEVYGGAVGLSACCLYGGSPYRPQETALRRGVDIVIGTPGRVKVIHSKCEKFVKLIHLDANSCKSLCKLTSRRGAEIYVCGEVGLFRFQDPKTGWDHLLAWQPECAADRVSVLLYALAQRRCLHCCDSEFVRIWLACCVADCGLAGLQTRVTVHTLQHRQQCGLRRQSAMLASAVRFRRSGAELDICWEAGLFRLQDLKTGGDEFLEWQPEFAADRVSVLLYALLQRRFFYIAATQVFGHCLAEWQSAWLRQSTLFWCVVVHWV